MKYIVFFKFNYSLTIEFIASNFGGDLDFQEVIVSDFNKYVKKQNLDINIHRTSLTTLNSSIHVDEYAAFIEAKLKKNLKIMTLFLSIIFMLIDLLTMSLI